MARWLDAAEVPAGNVTPSSKAFLVNAGLPRTGTTSFAEAATKLGLRVLHSWNAGRQSEQKRDMFYRKHFRDVLTGISGELTSYDALTDTPFYSRAVEMRRAYPNATFVCTTRAPESWADSMMYGTRTAPGGMYFPRLFADPLLRPPYRNTTQQRRNLTRAMAVHARSVCDAVSAPRLDLRDSSQTLWSTLCAALPPALGHAPRERCAALLAAGTPWPQRHVEVSRKASVGG